MDLRGGGRACIFLRIEVFGLLGPGDVQSTSTDFLAIEGFKCFFGVLLSVVVDECVEAL